MSRPGRPRKAGKRHANGRLVSEREVGPTREQAIRRQALAGVTGDPTRTSSPLDLMLLHRLVADDAGKAASWFGYTARAVLGAPVRKNILDNGPRPAEMSDGRHKRLTNEYIAAIQGLGRAERDLLIDLLHFQKTPFWLLADIARRPQKARDAALRSFTLRALGKLELQWRAYHYAARRPRLVAPMVAVAAE